LEGDAARLEPFNDLEFSTEKAGWFAISCMGITNKEDPMSALKTRECIGLGMLFVLTLASSALAEDVSIRGKVQGYDDKPIFNIKVGVYDDRRLLTQGFTGEDGTYAITLPASKIVTVRFDTSTSLNNSGAWHPSVVANISAEKDVLLYRRLMGVGQGGTGTAEIDALHGYEFAALWIKAEPAADQAAYAKIAASRISELKLQSRILIDMEELLRNYFYNYRPE
jgi:hypothetical protein